MIYSDTKVWQINEKNIISVTSRETNIRQDTRTVKCHQVDWLPRIETDFLSENPFEEKLLCQIMLRSDSYSHFKSIEMNKKIKQLLWQNPNNNVNTLLFFIQCFFALSWYVRVLCFLQNQDPIWCVFVCVEYVGVLLYYILFYF